MARLEKDKQKARNDMDKIAALFILFIIIFATTLGIYVAIKYKIEEIEQQCHELKTAIKDCEYYVLKSLSAMKNAKDKKETIENTKMTLDELFDQLNTDSIVISFDKYKLQERTNHTIWGRELIVTRKGEQNNEALNMAIEALEQEPKWIPVTERLPKAGEYVGDVAKYYLVQNEYGDMLVARFTHSEYWEQMYQLKPHADKIVAWMPLPEPYKESEE